MIDERLRNKVHPAPSLAQCRSVCRRHDRHVPVAHSPGDRRNAAEGDSDSATCAASIRLEVDGGVSGRCLSPSTTDICAAARCWYRGAPLFELRKRRGAASCARGCQRTGHESRHERGSLFAAAVPPRLQHSVLPIYRPIDRLIAYCGLPPAPACASPARSGTSVGSCSAAGTRSLPAGRRAWASSPRRLGV